MGNDQDIRELLGQLKRRRVTGEITREEYREIREDLADGLSAAERAELGLGTTPTPTPPGPGLGPGGGLGPSGGFGGGMVTQVPTLSQLDLEPGTVLLDQFRIVRVFDYREDKAQLLVAPEEQCCIGC